MLRKVVVIEHSFETRFSYFHMLLNRKADSIAHSDNVCQKETSLGFTLMQFLHGKILNN